MFNRASDLDLDPGRLKWPEKKKKSKIFHVGRADCLIGELGGLKVLSIELIACFVKKEVGFFSQLSFLMKEESVLPTIGVDMQRAYLMGKLSVYENL